MSDIKISALTVVTTPSATDVIPIVSSSTTKKLALNNINTLGTITTGVWNGTVIGLAYGGTGANLTAASGGMVYSGASALAITAAADLFWDSTNKRLGIGTNAVPKGSVGLAKFAIEGTNGSTAGPHVQFTTSNDNYPLMQILNYTHDNVALCFDAYFDGTNWKSGYSSSNFAIYKQSGKLNFNYAAIAQGSTISAWTAALSIDSNGNVVVSSAALATNATNGFLYIDTCAGAPTGTPTAFTGRVALIYDTTNNNFYIYNGAWKKVTLT